MKVIRLKHLLKGNFGGVWGDDLDCNENSYTYILRSTEQNENGNWVINWESVARRNLLRVTNFHTLKKNDIVITKSSGSAGHIGKATLVDENIEKLHCSFSNFMQCLQLDAGKCNPRFYWYYLNSRHCKEQYKISCTTSTGLLNLNSDTFNNLNVPFFSVEYQNQCVAFLDKIISKIEDAIEKHKIQLDFLSSYRQSLITRAVTKGLDPNVEMKDSGVEWIGDIPKHWQISTLGRIGTFKGGDAFPVNLQWRSDNEISFYKVANLGIHKESIYLKKSENTIAKEDAIALKANIINPGSIVYAKIGAALLLNRRRIVNEPCCIDNNMTAFTLRTGNLLWAYYFLSTIDFGMYTCPATVPSLSEGRQSQIPIAIPPMNEQIEIGEYISSRLEKFQELYDSIIEMINNMKEYRSSLISAAVTGQLAIEEAEE